MQILNNLNISILQDSIYKHLINNITKSTCLALANIIAIDYVTRLNSKPVLKDYITESIRKLKIFLGQRVITDDSFSIVLMLFAIAISPEDVEYKDKDNILNKEQLQDKVIDNLININFSNVNSDDKETIKLIFKDLFTRKNSYELINYMQLHPKLFHTTLMYALKKYRNQNEINDYVNVEINNILNLTKNLNHKTNLFKQASSKILTAFCALAVGAISVITAGAIFSVIIVPASILTIKYAPKLGEQIGKIILNYDHDITSEIERTNIIQNSLLEKNDKFLIQQQLIEQKTLQKIEADNKATIIANMKIKKLDTTQSQIKSLISSKNQLNSKIAKEKSIIKRAID